MRPQDKLIRRPSVSGMKPARTSMITDMEASTTTATASVYTPLP